MLPGQAQVIEESGQKRTEVGRQKPEREDEKDGDEDQVTYGLQLSQSKEKICEKDEDKKNYDERRDVRHILYPSGQLDWG